jgi:hypothetical protein
MSDKSHSRGYYGESRLAKKVRGKVVGRSKAIVLDSGKVILIDHQHPPDVVNDWAAFESKYRKVFPKSISEAMLQAETNCPDGLVPVLVVKDPYRKKYYYIQTEEDFLEQHVGEKKP